MWQGANTGLAFSVMRIGELREGAETNIESCQLRSDSISVREVYRFVF